MICIGMPKEILSKQPMYDSFFHVFTDMEGFYSYAYDNSINTFVITDKFIKLFFYSNSLIESIQEIQKIRQKLDIVLLGEECSYEIAGTYLIKEKWDLPTHTSNLIARLYQRKKTLSTNRYEYTYRDFKLNSRNSKDILMYILANPYESMEFLRELLNEYKRINMNTNAILNKAATLELENKNLMDQLDNVKIHCKESDKKYSLLRQAYDSLISKINTQYFPYEEEGDGGYEPAIIHFEKILYVKEISQVKYTQTMLYYLQNILNTISDNHTRSIIIECPYTYHLEPLYPNFVAHNKLTHGELINSDLLMIGYQKDILLSVLQNTTRNKYLIIWDRTGTENIYVKNQKVRVLYCLSDIKDNEHFHFPETNILCYEESLKHISYIKEFESMGIQEKMAVYSSMPIIKELIAAMET